MLALILAAVHFSNPALASADLASSWMAVLAPHGATEVKLYKTQSVILDPKRNRKSQCEAGGDGDEELCGQQVLLVRTQNSVAIFRVDPKDFPRRLQTLIMVGSFFDSKCEMSIDLKTFAGSLDDSTVCRAVRYPTSRGSKTTPYRYSDGWSPKNPPAPGFTELWDSLDLRVPASGELAGIVLHYHIRGMLGTVDKDITLEPVLPAVAVPNVSRIFRLPTIPGSQAFGV